MKSNQSKKIAPNCILTFAFLQRCKEGFEHVRPDLCLEVHENPYVAKLVDFLMEMDKGFTYGRSFKDFGAHHTHKINGKELLVSKQQTFESVAQFKDYLFQDKLVPVPEHGAEIHHVKQHEVERNNAGLALLSVFATLDPKTD